VLEKTKLSEAQFTSFSLSIFKALTIVPNFLLSARSVKQSLTLCEQVDPKDAPFVALSLELGYPLLTRDAKLHKGLRKQGFKDITLFQDFLNQI